MNRSSRFSDPASPEVRALAAAMRVALGSALVVACGGRLAPELETPTPSTGSNVSPTAPATSAPAPASEASKSCDARLAEAFPDGGAPFYVNDTPPSTDPALVACCERITADASRVEQTEILRASGCCHVAFSDNVGACTPWGPPVPPSMPMRLA